MSADPVRHNAHLTEKQKQAIIELTRVIAAEPAIAHYCLFKHDWKSDKAAGWYFTPGKPEEARREVGDGWEAKQQKPLSKPATEPKAEAPAASKIVVSDGANRLNEILLKRSRICMMLALKVKVTLRLLPYAVLYV